MNKTETTFIQIMLFYAFLTYLLFPFIGYHFYKLFIGKAKLNGAGNGFVIGSLVSLLLWYFYGRNLV